MVSTPLLVRCHCSVVLTNSQQKSRVSLVTTAPPSIRPTRLDEAQLTARVLGGPDPTAEVLRWAAELARVPFWQRRALDVEALGREHGVPPGPAARLVALWELADRWDPDQRPAVASARDAALLCSGLADTQNECVLVLLLDGRLRLLASETVAIGGVNVARLQPRDVFAPAMLRGAAAVVVAHSHPSGDADPSRADRQMTMALREAAAVIGIPLLDHIVVARRAYHSFARSDGWSDIPGWTDDDADSCY
jgi:DNA repair protein RadC